MADLKKMVYPFEEGSADMRQLLGGKGANLAEMTKIGMPVPPGFTITTEACKAFLDAGNKFPTGLWEQVEMALAKLEKKTKKGFGDPENPLLISVRSGAPVSMPGMMDTVLNLGLNEDTLQGIIARTGNERFAWDSYRRFVNMFGTVVLDVPHSEFEKVLTQHKRQKRVKLDTELDSRTLSEVTSDYKKVVENATGEPLPEEPMEQLQAAVAAVFSSWNTPRAVEYRRIEKIPDDLFTGVNVQTMVFGNMGENSFTGVAFTRNPSTGENKLYGEYLPNAQGEDVVAGIRTPKHIEELAEDAPDDFKQFTDICSKLETYYKDVQDVEFTIENGTLYMLQTRDGKRTGRAAVKIAVDMVAEGLITKEQALLRVPPSQLNQVLHPQIDPTARFPVLAEGLPASPGAVSGKVVFNSDEAKRRGDGGEDVILVRPETTPDDIHGVAASRGVLTSRGGMTSHAAVVARQMGKTCVAGCEALKIDLRAEHFTVGDVKVLKDDIITIEGSSGRVVLGEVPTVPPEIDDDFITFMSWARDKMHMGVHANADTPADAMKAREFGATGIGLCRVEHMLIGPDRLPSVQRMILARTETGRQKELDSLKPLLKEDFKEIFRAMDGYPVTVRLIDPPLHEFLPNRGELELEVAALRLMRAPASKIKSREKLLNAVRQLSEQNPMLGFRGCRLAVRYPEITRMQVSAIIEAALELKRERVDVHPEIMVPLIMSPEELERIVEDVKGTADGLIADSRTGLSYKIGTMLETPRSCLVAGELAKTAQFFSFGTNDLTQMTLAISRDDAEKGFILDYLSKRILRDNPFESLDQVGVGRLMKDAIKEGLKARPDLVIGICGEHGGDPSSVKFCHSLNLDYVSCSPYRVPIAILSSAQAALEDEGLKRQEQG